MVMFGGTEWRAVSWMAAVGIRKGVDRTFSINLPIPETVTDLPPKICAASSAISLPVRVIYLRSISLRAVLCAERY